jgi:hypothetical protein
LHVALVVVPRIVRARNTITSSLGTVIPVLVTGTPRGTVLEQVPVTSTGMTEEGAATQASMIEVVETRFDGKRPSGLPTARGRDANSAPMTTSA